MKFFRLLEGNRNVAVGSASSGTSNGLYVSGNAGIGMTAPSCKLQVNGNASIAMGLKVGNDDNRSWTTF